MLHTGVLQRLRDRVARQTLESAVVVVGQIGRNHGVHRLCLGKRARQCFLVCNVCRECFGPAACKRGQFFVIASNDANFLLLAQQCICNYRAGVSCRSQNYVHDFLLAWSCRALIRMPWSAEELSPRAWEFLHWSFSQIESLPDIPHPRAAQLQFRDHSSARARCASPFLLSRLPRCLVLNVANSRFPLRRRCEWKPTKLRSPC